MRHFRRLRGFTKKGCNVSKSIIRLPAVQQKTNLSRSTIYRLEAQGLFPPRVRLGENSTGWYEHEIDAWITNRPRVSGKPKTAGSME